MTSKILIPALKIKPPSWMMDSDLITLLDALNKDDLNARIVGGCIRNFLFNKKIYDIDIACKLPPDKTIEICKKIGIKIIPTGIKHGTITAHLNGRNFEITSLRQDIKTDGRHADVTYTDDWTKDAQRRDFTINALYADRDGSIYDPLGESLNDIQSRTVRFIGTPEHRIKEDYLRILRYFRFYAEYNDGAIDIPSLNACYALKDGIENLSDERIVDELFKILESDNAAKAIALMGQGDILGINEATAPILDTLISLQNQLEIPHITTRYSLLFNNIKYIKNNNLIKFIKTINEFKSNWDGALKKALYHYDRDIVVQGLLTLKAEGQDIDDMLISSAMTQQTPKFPVTATDIMEHFKIPEGRKVGEKLRQAEALWIQSNFELPREKLLDIL